ncbi:MAG: ribosome biogenesis GTPase YlqF [Oscillospiraceae bacterium]|nr:ribosome biogenesis GTPase YlqF [Oscillospiraceae bacterium]
MRVNWFPGHMAKTRRILTERIRLVDAVIEVADARLPKSSRNPDLAKLARDKASALILNKADLADAQETDRWVSFYNKIYNKTTPCIAYDSAHGKVSPLLAVIDTIAKPIVERYKSRGMAKTVRVMVTGIPNVGKSTLINRLAGKMIAQAEDRPGVTRATRWIKISDYLELLDTPGMLMPKIEDTAAGKRLAYVGTIKDGILETEELAEYLLRDLMNLVPSAVLERYHLPSHYADSPSLLELAAIGRGFLLSGGRLNLERAAAVVLDEFRAGVLGRVTLEKAEL